LKAQLDFKKLSRSRNVPSCQCIQSVRAFCISHMLESFSTFKNKQKLLSFKGISTNARKIETMVTSIKSFNVPVFCVYMESSFSRWDL